MVDETNPPADPAPILACLADYYPFGWLLPDRKVLEYRYGYQGNEEDPETGWTAYTFREYNARVARFFRVDPLIKKYPSLSPYQLAGNSPVKNSELEGAESSDETGSGFSLRMFLDDPIGYLWDKIVKPVHPGANFRQTTHELSLKNLPNPEDKKVETGVFIAAGVKATYSQGVGSAYGRIETDGTRIQSGVDYSAGMALDNKYVGKLADNNYVDPDKPNPIRFFPKEGTLQDFTEGGILSGNTLTTTKFSFPLISSGVMVGNAYLSVGANPQGEVSGFSIGYESPPIVTISQKGIGLANRSKSETLVRPLPLISNSFKITGGQLHGF